MKTQRFACSRNATRDVLILGAATSFFLCALSLLLVFRPSDSTTRPVAAGRLISSGTLRRLPANRDSWIVVREGEILFAGDTVQSDTVSGGTIRLSDDTNIVLAKDSTIQIDVNSDKVEVTLLDGDVKVPDGTPFRQSAARVTQGSLTNSATLAFPEVIPMPIPGPTP